MVILEVVFEEADNEVVVLGMTVMSLVPHTLYARRRWW
jgi:hypothetical protein